MSNENAVHPVDEELSLSRLGAFRLQIVFVMILTITLVMIVVMIESTGKLLALGEMTDKKIEQPELSGGLRTDGLGTLIGGIFNTFPYTSFSQNVGLVVVAQFRAT